MRDWHYIRLAPSGKLLYKDPSKTGGYGTVCSFATTHWPEGPAQALAVARLFQSSPDLLEYPHPKNDRMLLRWERYGPTTGTFTQIYKGEINAVTLLLSGRRR